jgi:cell division septum initiation protein DivIVA
MHGTRDEAVPLPPPFEVVLRGFDRQQVIEHFNALKARLVAIGGERDAALQRAAELDQSHQQLRREAADTARQIDRLRHEAVEAAAQIDRLQRSPVTVASERIQRMLQMAEDEAAELQASAARETTSLSESARAEADRLLAEATARCERLDAESQRRRQTADTDSLARRQQAEQQCEQDIASRQAEMEAWIRDYQSRGIAALYLILQIAGERLSSRVVKVTRQVSAARRLRSEVTGQLSDVHRLLAEALGVVDQPTPAEQAERTEMADRAEQVERTGHAERTAQAERSKDAEQCEPPGGSPPPPASNGDGSDAPPIDPGPRTNLRRGTGCTRRGTAWRAQRGAQVE